MPKERVLILPHKKNSRPAKRRSTTKPSSRSSKKSLNKDSKKSSRSHSKPQRSQIKQANPHAKPESRIGANSRPVKTNQSGQLSDQTSSGEKKPQSNTKAYFVEVDSEHAGQRVDNFLITHLKGVPKTHIYRIIRKGEVRVNKGRVKQVTRLKLGDSIRIPPIRLSEPSGPVDAAKYEFLRKAILFEDDALLVINKPSGMAVHAGSGIKVGVIEALRALRTDIKYLELVHRLDRETSGCLVLAKKSSALKKLHDDFKTNSLKNKRLDKRYMALVMGYWKHGQRQINKPLNTDARKHGERFVVVDEAGRYASSIVMPVVVSDAASLLEVKLLTGRTHQVRVHLLSENHPIGGDSKYGDKEFNKEAKKHKLNRLFLHASTLTFNHPVSGDSVTVTAPLPKELNLVLDSFKLCTN